MVGEPITNGGEIINENANEGRSLLCWQKPKKTPKRLHKNHSIKEILQSIFDPRRDVVSFKRGVISAVVELFCTFLFVFYATAAVVTAEFYGINQTLIVAFGQGMALAIAVFIASSISGGHLNPAVTIALFLVGRMSLIRTLFYVAAQFSGAMLASLVLRAIIPNQFEGLLGATTVNPVISTSGAFFLELIMTATLMFVLFRAAIDPVLPGGNAFGAFAVGTVVLIDVIIGLEWTGASMNPARTLGPQLLSHHWDKYWLYFFAPVSGATIAAILYELYLKIKPYEPHSNSRLFQKKPIKTDSPPTATAKVENPPVENAPIA